MLHGITMGCAISSVLFVKVAKRKLAACQKSTTATYLGSSRQQLQVHVVPMGDVAVKVKKSPSQRTAGCLAWLIVSSENGWASPTAFMAASQHCVASRGPWTFQMAYNSTLQIHLDLILNSFITE